MNSLGNFRDFSGIFGKFPTIPRKLCDNSAKPDAGQPGRAYIRGGQKIMTQWRESYVDDGEDESNLEERILSYELGSGPWPWEEDHGQCPAKDGELADGPSEGQCLTPSDYPCLVDQEDAAGDATVTVAMLENLMVLVQWACDDQVRMDPAQTGRWRGWANDLLRCLRCVSEPRMRPYAGRIAAKVAGVFGGNLLDALGEVESLQSQDELSIAHQYKALTEQLKEEMEHVKRENAALRERLKRLRKSRGQPPQTTKVTIPAQAVTVRSPVQQEIIRLMGKEGLGRSWRIIECIVGTGMARKNSVRNALRALTKRGLVDDYRRHGKPVRWKVTAGGSRRLVVLTERGTAWFCEAFGQEPVESEIVWAARQHRSAAHGVGILEARDHLRAAGYVVDDDPQAILACTQERWGTRIEPDLMAQACDGQAWPVEVQREVSERLLDKWCKALSLTECLALVLFNEEHLRKQERLLDNAARDDRLPSGTVMLASLEAMERGDWNWVTTYSYL
jgi:hypothetical protein